jgi:tetratricopeptide (TPR) repeat protein
MQPDDSTTSSAAAPNPNPHYHQNCSSYGHDPDPVDPSSCRTCTESIKGVLRRTRIKRCECGRYHSLKNFSREHVRSTAAAERAAALVALTKDMAAARAAVAAVAPAAVAQPTVPLLVPPPRRPLPPSLPPPPSSSSEISPMPRPERVLADMEEDYDPLAGTTLAASERPGEDIFQLVLRSGSAETSHALATSMYARGRYRDAEALFQRAWRLRASSATESPEVKAYTLLGLGRSRALVGRAIEAEQIYKECIQLCDGSSGSGSGGGSSSSHRSHRSSSSSSSGGGSGATNTNTNMNTNTNTNTEGSRRAEMLALEAWLWLAVSWDKRAANEGIPELSRRSLEVLEEVHRRSAAAFGANHALSRASLARVEEKQVRNDGSFHWDNERGFGVLSL